MKKIVRLKNGDRAIVDFFCVIEDGRITYFVIEPGKCDRVVNSKVYYRPERTWDDHMGNTPCGYYVNVRFSTGERHRVYIHH